MLYNRGSCIKARRCERNALSLCARACGSPHPCFPSLLALEKNTSRNMCPCDAKGMFFSKVEVLRAPQSKRPRVTVLHVALDGVGAAPNAGPVVAVGSVPTEYSLLLLHAYNVCVCVFEHSQQSFISYAFYNVPRAAYLVAPRRLVVGLRQSGDSVDTERLFFQKSKNHKLYQ